MPKLHGNPFKSELYDQIHQLTESARFWRSQWRRLRTDLTQALKQLREETQRREAAEQELSGLKLKRFFEKLAA